MLTLIVIVIQVCIAVFFIRYVIRHDRGSKEPRQGLRAAIGFGFLSIPLVLLANFILGKLPTIGPAVSINSEVLRAGGYPLEFLLLAMILVGIIEEAAKALPLALYIWKKPYFNELTDGLFYFGISGVIFSVTESILYTLTFGGGIGVMRIIITPFLHTGFSMWFGYFLARRKITGNGTWKVPASLIFAMLLHGLYNFGLSSKNVGATLFSLLLAVALNIGVFLLYHYAQKRDSRMQLSADGVNNFCRNCGQPNPDHTLYCEHCGQRT